MVYSEKNIWHQNMYLLIFKSSVDFSAIWLPSLREAINDGPSYVEWQIFDEVIS